MDIIVWLDLETSRLDPATCEIIQIAAIATDRHSLKELDRFECKVHFDVSSAASEALERNAYDAAVWSAEAISQREAMNSFTAFLHCHSTWHRVSSKGNHYTTCEIGGHNIAQYDAPILQRWYKDLGAWCPCATYASMVVDTMFWARSLEFALGERWETGFSNKALCDRFGISLENEHDALADIEATVELARALRRLMHEQFEVIA